MRLNHKASLMDLYDMVSPKTPSHVNKRYAIEKHRNGERPPVMMLPDNE